jgi:CBS domain-containing protein
MTLGEFMDDVVWERRHTTYPVVRDGGPVGLLPFRRVAEIPRGEWDERHVRDAMLDRALVPTLGPDERAIDALWELDRSGASRALVLADGRLVGLLSISDLARALEAPPRRRRAAARGA